MRTMAIRKAGWYSCNNHPWQRSLSKSILKNFSAMRRSSRIKKRVAQISRRQPSPPRPKKTEYFASAEELRRHRDALIEKANIQRSDYAFRQSLSATATRACKVVSRVRDFEITSGRKDVLKRIVKRMPKGALLHAHLSAMPDVEWLINTGLSQPGMCCFSTVDCSSSSRRETAYIIFKPNSRASYSTSIWNENYVPGTIVDANEAANTYPDGGRQGFINWMRNRCTVTDIESLEHHLGIDDVWTKFQSISPALASLTYYEPIFRAFMQKTFRELVDDGIFWVEFREVFMKNFFLQGRNIAEESLVIKARVIDEEVEKFKRSAAGKDFWGARVIWCKVRRVDSQELREDMEDCIQIKKQYPHLIAGYDLVGQEDKLRTISEYATDLIWFQNRCKEENVIIPFFFHAGETLGDGTNADINLFDAVLLNTRRIGHGYSLYKHPTLMELVKEKQILVEACPISNKILRMSATVSGQTFPALLAHGVACCLNNDDPGIFDYGSVGIWPDFLQVLQNFENVGLAGLGSLAQNSIRWAAFEDENDDEWKDSVRIGSGIRGVRMMEWEKQWEDFCSWINDAVVVRTPTRFVCKHGAIEF